MKTFILMAIVGILLVLATPTMAASVPGIWISGNPTCEELGQSLGYNWVGLKIDPVTAGTHSDGTLTVDVVVSGKSFDWTSNIPVSAVFVKGGPGGSLYNYETAESLGDTHLISLRDSDAKQFGLSHLNFCYDLDLELEVSKDAQTSFTRTWQWDIEKTVDIPQHDLPDGQDGTSNYTVDLFKTGYTDSDWLVTGNIWIHNPSSVAATIEGVEDVVSDAGNATVDCGVSFPYVLAASGDLHCTYSLALSDGADRLNTVTVTTSGDVNGGSATADVVFGNPTTEVNAEVNVTDSVVGDLGSADGDATFTYSRTFTCSQDAGTHPNTATIVETGQSADADVVVECQPPVDVDLEVSKDAQTSYTRTWQWDIEKTVDTFQHDLFDGQDGTSNYTVEVFKIGYTDSDWLVTGNIWIHNPSSVAATIEAVEDVVSDAGNATVDCGVDFPYVLAAGGDLHCTYSLVLSDDSYHLNTVTVYTSSGVGGSAVADVVFGDPTTELYAEINVEDSLVGYLGIVSESEGIFEYAHTFTCSEDEGLQENIATIVETGQSASASVQVNCYRPEVSKTAETSWIQTYEWTIEKTVDVDLHQLFDGDSGISNYTVSVYRTSVGSDFYVTGLISVYNPHPWDSLIVDVTDVISDGIVADLDCGGNMDIGPGDTETCWYSAFLPDNADRLNEAIISAFGIDYYAYADVIFGEPDYTDGYPSINVEDSYTGYLGSADGDTTFTYSRTFTCDEDEGTHPNTAIIVETGQSADVDVVVECFEDIDVDLEVSKDAQTSYTRTWEWDIEKTVDIFQHDLFDGQDGTSNYTVEVFKTGYTDSDWLVTGNIWIHNPAPLAATIQTIEDVVSDAGYATVDCGVDFPYVLPANGDLHCTYFLALSDDSYRLNTVTVYTSGGVGGSSATADVIFGDPTTELNAEINVTDTLVGDLGMVVDSEAVFDYSYTFTCGEDEGFNDNTATIVETGQSSSASVQVNCYRPEVSKTAETSWTETYEWSITKTVDVAYHQLSEGESGTSNYTVSVYRTAIGSDFYVSGLISVYNPHPWDSLVVNVTDVISGGVVADLDCGGIMDIGPGDTETCWYSAFLPDNSDRVNEAIVSAFGIDYYAYADVTFGEPAVNGYPTVNVDDTYTGYLGSADGDTTFTYSRTFTCGQDAGTFPNTATIIETGQSASATVTVDCINSNPPTWCSPGYWKQPHHLDSWPIDPNTPYNDVFDPDLPGNPTLLDVISQPEVYGGPVTNMIADYLSGLHPDVNFDGTRYEDSCPLN